MFVCRCVVCLRVCEFASLCVAYWADKHNPCGLWHCAVVFVAFVLLAWVCVCVLCVCLCVCARFVCLWSLVAWCDCLRVRAFLCVVCTTTHIHMCHTCAQWFVGIVCVTTHTIVAFVTHV